MRELSLKDSVLDERYEIVRLLGRGSYAEVFLADDLHAAADSVNSTVVVKALNVEMHDEVDADLERTLIENFQNEAVALDRVRHPNIVSRLGHGTARDLEGKLFHYIVLEYLPGGDLAALLKRGPLGVPRAVGYLRQICDALTFAHSKGIIHRDIKPQNLLLSEDLSLVKIADFGVARFAESLAPVTRVGTNIFSPPEHNPLGEGSGSLGSASDVGPASDVYSLAKFSYVLLTGESPRQFAARQIDSLPESVSGQLWRENLLRVLRKATSPEPGLRHASVNAYLRDIEDALDALPDEAVTAVSARPPSPQTPVPRRTEFGVKSAEDTRPATVRPSGVPGAKNFRPVSVKPRGGDLEGPMAFHGAPLPRSRRKKSRRLFVSFLLLATLVVSGVAFDLSRGVRGVLGGTFWEMTSWILPAKTGTATADVFIRQEPNVSSKRLGVLPAETTVRIVNSRNNWYEIEHDGRRGWVNAKFVKLR